MSKEEMITTIVAMTFIFLLLITITSCVRHQRDMDNAMQIMKIQKGLAEPTPRSLKNTEQEAFP